MTTKDWREEFDEKFIMTPTKAVRIRDFIQTLITKETQRCLKALPEERVIHDYMPEQNTPENRAWNDYRNQAIKNISE